MKKIFCFGLIFLLLVSTSYFSVNALKEGSTYSIQPEFTEKIYSDYISNSLVMRIGNTRGFVNGYRLNMDKELQNVMPYTVNGESYVPVIFSFENLGMKVEKQDKYTVKVKTDIGDLTISADLPIVEGSKNIEYINGNLYAPSKDIATITKMHLYDDGELIIISPNKTVEAADKAIVSQLKSALEWRAGKMYLGDEGYVTGIEIHPKDPNVRYSRTDVGGCYRWQPESKTWIQLLNVIPNDRSELVGVRTLALDPNNTDVVYVMLSSSFTSKYGGVFKSTDKGETWTNILSVPVHSNHKTRFTGEAIAVDPNNSSIVYVGTQKNGLMVSTDGGNTWNQNAAISNWIDEYGINIVMFDPNSKNEEGKTNNIYVSVCGDGIYKSEDAGSTFHKIEGTPNAVQRMELCDGYLFVAAGATTTTTGGVPAIKGGLWKYKNNKWTDLTPSPHNQGANMHGITDFVIDYTNHNFIVAAGETFTTNYGARYRSKDGGKTWEYFRMDLTWSNVSCMVQDPLNSKRILVGDGAGLTTIEDIYAQIVNDRLSLGYEERGMEELVCLKVMSLGNSNAPMLLISCYDRGFLYAEDMFNRGMTQAREQNVDYGWAVSMDYCQEDPSFVARLGRLDNQDHIVLSTDYGRYGKRIDSWSAGDAVISLALSSTLQENGYPVMIAGRPKQNGVEGSLYRSKDWGKTWEKLEGVKSNASSERWSRYWRYLLISDAVDGDTFYYCENENFYVTTDGGDTWVKTYQFNTGEDKFSDPSMQAVPGKEGEVYLQSGTYLWKTMDKGNTWTKIENVKLDSRSFFSFGKGKEGLNTPALYLVGLVNNVKGVYISDDMGKSFRRIDDDSQSYIIGDETGVAGDMGVYGRVFVSTGNTGVTYFELASLDDVAPTIKVENKSTSDTSGIHYAVDDDKLTIKGTVNERCEVRINNQPVELTKELAFEHTLILLEGENSIRIEAVDSNENKAKPVYLNVRYIPNFFELEFENKTSILTKENSVTISGVASKPATIFVNDISVKTDADNKFNIEHPLDSENNILNVYGVSDDGIKSKETIISVTKDTIPPSAEITNLPSEPIEKKMFNIKGKINEPGEVRINDKNVTVEDDLTFSTFVSVDGEKGSFKLQSKDAAGNVNKPEYFTILRDLTNAIDKSRLDIKYKSDDFVFDGDINEWNLEYELDELYWGETDNFSKFGLMWDEEYLYVAAKTTDSVIFTDNSTIHQNDCIEVYIDGTNSKGTKYDKFCKQYIYVAGKTVNDAISKCTDDGYVIEIAIPWVAFSMTGKEGIEIGLDIDNIDNDNNLSDQTRCGIIGFNGTKDNWQNQSPWTTFKLVK